MKSKTFIGIHLFFIFLSYFAWGTSDVKLQKVSGWQKSDLVDEDTWNALQPYLLPANHPIKPKLDQIFSVMRATATPLTMQGAGFQSLDIWKWDKVYVVKHPNLKGYLIKAYLDDQLYMDDIALVNRIIGAEALRDAIHAYGYQSLFKVPHKWLYPLPAIPHAPSGLLQKNFILIVEDMLIVNKQENNKKYYSISENELLPLFILINSLGLADSIYIKNIPFSKDGKIAFVDLERHHLWPVPFKKLTPQLNSMMQKYWNELAR